MFNTYRRVPRARRVAQRRHRAPRGHRRRRDRRAAFASCRVRAPRSGEFILTLVWAISLTPCFVYKGRTGLNADSSRSHFIVGLCVETGECILTFVRAIRVTACLQTRLCRNFFWWTSRGAKRCVLPRKYPNTTQIQPEHLPWHRANRLTLRALTNSSGCEVGRVRRQAGRSQRHQQVTQRAR